MTTTGPSIREISTCTRPLWTWLPLFSPALCLVDATTILTQGGPFGPGRVIHPNKVYAGKDMVALDALCCGLLGVKPEEVMHIQLAHESGMGQMNLAAGAIKHLRL